VSGGGWGRSARCLGWGWARGVKQRHAACCTRRPDPLAPPRAPLAAPACPAPATARRSTFLKALLEREQLFATDVGKSLEQQARANLAHELGLTSRGLLLPASPGARRQRHRGRPRRGRRAGPACGRRGGGFFSDTCALPPPCPCPTPPPEDELPAVAEGDEEGSEDEGAAAPA
jgi:hypothetical protein